MVNRIFLILVLSPFILTSFSHGAQSHPLVPACEGGRWIQPSFPSCDDLENPNTLTKSCRAPEHGLDATPASVIELKVVSDWEAGGSGTYDELCRKKISLGPLQTATFINKTNEDEKKDWGKAKYKYECLYSIRTDQYAEKVSASCVSPEELYPRTNGPQCLSQAQSTHIEAVANHGYDSEAFSAYIASLGNDITWSENATVPLDEDQPVALCSTCSDVAQDRPLAEKYKLQVECLSSLITYNPTLDSMSPSELEALKSIGEKLDRGMTLNQVDIAEDKQKFVEAIIGFLQDL